MSLEKEVERYSKLNGYEISNFETIECTCGESQFHLHSDDEEGGAYVICSTCKAEQDIEDSRSYIEESYNNICNCDNDCLNIGVGISYYPETDDPRWVYVGAHCDKCGLDGVYVDWKQS